MSSPPLPNAAYTPVQLHVTKLVNNLSVVVEPHPTYNNLDFVFTCGSIASLTVDEIKDHLEEDNVTDIYRFTRKSNGKSVLKNSYVVTTQGVKIPEYIHIGMKRIKTRVYYPRPKCANCGGAHSVFDSSCPCTSNKLN
uniref:Pre-C2HC domain-containing protein n=1 Tax=Anopheles merus TaxID=30066 RepID=A0A182V852_ANOME